MAEGAPVLVGVGGLSGSGKSTVASALAPMLAPIPGARVLSSDRIRKALFGAAPTDRLPQEAYAPQVSERVYAIARENAGKCLAARMAGHLRCGLRPPRRSRRACAGRGATRCALSWASGWRRPSIRSRRALPRARAIHPTPMWMSCTRSRRNSRPAAKPMEWTRLDASGAAAGHRRAHQGRAEDLSAIRAGSRASGWPFRSTPMALQNASRTCGGLARMPWEVREAAAIIGVRVIILQRLAGEERAPLGDGQRDLLRRLAVADEALGLARPRRLSPAPRGSGCGSSRCRGRWRRDFPSCGRRSRPARPRR